MLACITKIEKFKDVESDALFNSPSYKVIYYFKFINFLRSFHVFIRLTAARIVDLRKQNHPNFNLFENQLNDE